MPDGLWGPHITSPAQCTCVLYVSCRKLRELLCRRITEPTKRAATRKRKREIQTSLRGCLYYAPEPVGGLSVIDCISEVDYFMHDFRNEYHHFYPGSVLQTNTFAYCFVATCTIRRVHINYAPRSGFNPLLKFYIIKVHPGCFQKDESYNLKTCKNFRSSRLCNLHDPSQWEIGFLM